MTAPSVAVSIDFELRWGVSHRLGTDPDAYRANLAGAPEGVERTLDLFARTGVRATWAVVGAVACEGWDEWRARAPAWPAYLDPKLRWHDAWRALDPEGRIHFAKATVDRIAATDGQELASHTFSHLFYQEPGVMRRDVIADAAAMRTLFAERWGRPVRSLVFPRNQVAFTDVLAREGYVAWRATPTPFYWHAVTDDAQGGFVRALRICDAIFPIGTRRSAASAQRASYLVRLGFPDRMWRMHLRRIAADAARLQGGEVLHLWWHPHNLGDDPPKRVGRLAELFDAVGAAVPAGTRYRTMGELGQG